MPDRTASNRASQVLADVPSGPGDRGPDDLMTVDELASRAGVSTRTVRFYAGKGLLPPPLMHGRLGLYDPVHQARLQLIRDLQDKGFTLTAIERYLDAMPPDASVGDVAVFRALLSPWVADPPSVLTRAELHAAAGRPLTDEAVDVLVTAGVVEALDDGRFRLRVAELQFGLQLLELAAPGEMLREARELIDEATGKLAKDLAALLRKHVIRPYLQEEVPEARRTALADALERLKPLTIEAVAAAMQRSVDRAVRGRLDQP